MQRLPCVVTSSFYDGAWGRLRSRSAGVARPGTPDVVMVQGLAVADYLLPGLVSLASWTRAHLLELPGFGGGWRAAAALSVPQFGRAVAGWLDHRGLGPVILGGHSSGTQVAAEASVGRSDVVGTVLVGPIVDPVSRGPARLGARWLLDGGGEHSGLLGSQAPEWRQAGARRLAHLIRTHLRFPLEDPVSRLRCPVLVLRGEDDRLSTPAWGRRLVELPRTSGDRAGWYQEFPGAHSFFWDDPDAWREPLRRFATAAH
jgi:pimeloyl-ACP methyl ester carboxylesterase